MEEKITPTGFDGFYDGGAGGCRSWRCRWLMLLVSEAVGDALVDACAGSVFCEGGASSVADCKVFPYAGNIFTVKITLHCTF